MRQFMYLFALLSFGIAQAQNAGAGGRAVLGGTFNMSSYNFNFDDLNGGTGHGITTIVRIVPYIGLVTNEHWMFGFQGGLHLHHTTSDDNGVQFGKITNNRSTYSVGVLARRFFMAGKPIRFFLEPGIRYAWFNHESKNLLPFTPINDNKIRELSIYMSPGFIWSVSEHFRLLARIGNVRYVSGKIISPTGDNTTKTGQFDLQMNAQTLTIGAEVGF